MIVSSLLPLLALPAEATPPPLDPGQEEARDLVVVELSKPPYQAAKPTAWDYFWQQLQDWMGALFDTDGGDASRTPLAWIAVLVGILLVAAVVWLVFRNVGSVARSEASDESPPPLLDGDRRSAAELRAAAEAAARTGDWPLAVAEQYRALARDLADRTIIVLRPGSTARDAARSAALAFPSHGPGLARAATAFDRVRYLDLPTSEAEWRALAALDAELSRARPERRAGVAELASASGGLR